MNKYIQRKQEHLDSVELDHEWIILNKRYLTMTKLNGMGGYCWSLLQNEQTLESLIDAIDHQFFIEKPHGDVEKDVVMFLSDLIDHGLVEVH